MSPMASAMIARIRIDPVRLSALDFRYPARCPTTVSTIARIGTPVLSAQVRIWRTITPGAVTFSGTPRRRA
ncbi:Uncharacterised protein [Mycobacteroides abscessus subsp. abscessus]|nr:Uncharacterised protein [Mycobacteroides abscessus subsp. abscessus]